MIESYSLPTTIGPIPIYGILLVTAFLVSVLTCYIEWRSKGHSKFKFWLLTLWVAFFALFGAKWWHLIFHPSDWDGFYSIFQISGGRSILGTIFFASLAAYVFIRIWIPELEWRRGFSIILPNMLIGQAIGRWGNFFNQEVYGLVMNDISWLPTWISDQMFIDGAYRQPLFLYESLADLFCFLWISFGMKFNSFYKPGTHAGSYLILYGTIRASMELFRDPQFIMNWNGFPTSFFMALVMTFIGLCLFIYYQYIFNDKIATYWQFISPLKRKRRRENIKSLYSKTIFKSKKPLKQSFKENNTHYKKTYNTINQEEVKSYLIQINKPY